MLTRSPFASLFLRFATLVGRFLSVGGKQLMDRTHRLNAVRVQKAVEQLQGLLQESGAGDQRDGQLPARGFRTGLEFTRQNSAEAVRRYRNAHQEQFGVGPDACLPGFIKARCLCFSWTGARSLPSRRLLDIEDIVKVDLRVLRFIFRVMGRLLLDWGFDMVYREVKEMVLSELDFRKEAAALKNRRARKIGPTSRSLRPLRRFAPSAFLRRLGWRRKVGDREGLLLDGICLRARHAWKRIANRFLSSGTTTQIPIQETYCFDAVRMETPS